MEENCQEESHSVLHENKLVGECVIGKLLGLKLCGISQKSFFRSLE